MEEEKSKKGLYIGLIIFLLLCLVGSGLFIYKRIYMEPMKKEETKEEEKVEIPNLANILRMIPVKRENANYIGYKVEDLTDKEINDAIVNYIVNNTELTTKDNEKFYLEKLSNVEDNLFNFLGLEKYEIKIDAGNSDIRYKLEKTTENDLDYLKVKLSEIATDAFDTFELQDLNNITYDDEKKEYTVNVLVIEHMGGGPDLKIGKDNIVLKLEDGKTILKEVQFEKYNETDPIE